MNFKQLRAFREVMLTGSVSEAARRLYRSQPAISALISSLEKNIGIELFYRKGMRLKPVPEAHYLFTEATQILEHLENTHRTMKSIRNFEHGELRIVSMPGPSVFLLPDFIHRFLDGREAIKVSLISKTSPQVRQLVSAQQFDIGFADHSLLTNHDMSLIKQELFEFDCLCAMRVDDPLAHKEVITPVDLSGKPMATLFEEHPTYLQTKAAFAEMDSEFNTMFEAQYFIPLYTFIERGLAYAVIDRLSAESYRLKSGQGKGEIIFRPFVPKVRLMTLVLSPQHTPLSLLAQQFLEQFKGLLSEIKSKSFSDFC